MFVTGSIMIVVGALLFTGHIDSKVSHIFMHLWTMNSTVALFSSQIECGLCLLWARCSSYLVPITFELPIAHGESTRDTRSRTFLPTIDQHMQLLSFECKNRYHLFFFLCIFCFVCLIFLEIIKK